MLPEIDPKATGAAYYGPLPKGGYELTITGVKNTETSIGKAVVIEYDIAEGKYKGFYQADYDAQTFEDRWWKGRYYLNLPTGEDPKKDTWSMNKLTAFVSALTQSNDKYVYDRDEQHFVGLTVGGLFNLREYAKDGRTIRITQLAKVVPVDVVRSGNFILPADKLLVKKEDAPKQLTFDDIMHMDDDELPFGK